MYFSPWSHQTTDLPVSLQPVDKHWGKLAITNQLLSLNTIATRNQKAKDSTDKSEKK